MSAALFNLAETILRNEPAGIAKPIRLRRLLPLITICCIVHGLCVGCFNVDSHKLLQPVYSAMKLPLLGFATFALSIPSFFVFHSMLGLREDFLPAMRAIALAQASAAIALVSLSPLVLVFYSATQSYQHAIIFNAFVFFVATLGGIPRLRAAYRHLIAKNPLHRRLMLAWLFTFAFVGMQMGYVLRPFIGAPGQTVTFFRAGQWENAYLVILRLFWQMFH